MIIGVEYVYQDKAAFNALLDNLEEELLSGNHDPEHEKLYHKYYEIGFGTW